jgi:hypothetical protein
MDIVMTYMNPLSLRNNQSRVKTSGKLPIILEESIEYTLELLFAFSSKTKGRHANAKAQEGS